MSILAAISLVTTLLAAPGIPERSTEFGTVEFPRCLVDTPRRVVVTYPARIYFNETSLAQFENWNPYGYGEIVVFVHYTEA